MGRYPTYKLGGVLALTFQVPSKHRKDPMNVATYLVISSNNALEKYNHSRDKEIFEYYVLIFSSFMTICAFVAKYNAALCLILLLNISYIRIDDYPATTCRLKIVSRQPKDTLIPPPPRLQICSKHEACYHRSKATRYQ